MAYVTGYDEVYRVLEIDPRLVAIASGQIPLPDAALSRPVQKYGFPPALIPIGSDRSTPQHSGVWRHWFSRRRQIYVTCSLGPSWANECGRSSQQFLIYLIAQLLGDRRAKELDQFAHDVGIDIQPIEKAIEDPKQFYTFLLAGHADLKTDPPVTSFRDASHYAGDFPNPAMPMSMERLSAACLIEMDDDLREKVNHVEAVPPWLRTNDQRPVFDRLLADRNLEGA